MSRYHYYILAAVALVLNSCYFNSAGHLFDKASYNAVATTIGVDKGQMMYTDGQECYIDVPLFRYDKKVTTQYSVFKEKDAASAEKVLTPKGIRTVKIPGDFAMYLVGEASSPRKPDYMIPVSDSVKRDCAAIPIVRKPQEHRVEFRYRSPGAWGYYTLGVLDWLCVDLPVTCVENSLAITGCTLAGVLGGLGKGLSNAGAAASASAATSPQAAGGGTANDLGTLLINSAENYQRNMAEQESLQREQEAAYWKRKIQNLKNIQPYLQYRKQRASSAGFNL